MNNMIINHIYNGDCLEVLKTLEDKCIHTCVTSPPYYGLRDYGTGKWKDGDPKCEHIILVKDHRGIRADRDQRGQIFYEINTCKNCGAKRIDAQIGLEETPEEYVNKLVEVFREVKRVLKDDGTLWLNLGDSYCTGWTGGNDVISRAAMQSRIIGRKKIPNELKPKDLIGIPWMVAFALRADGWYLRQDIIWHKLNPMPESVTDRCTKAHEYIFLLSKSNKYYYDTASIKEPKASSTITDKRNNNNGKRRNRNFPGSSSNGGTNLGGSEGDRNKRSVWTVATKPFRDAHFATFPQELIKPCILAGAPQNGIVLDPFMGAGTTAVVSRKLARNFVGIELNLEYVRIAEKRLTAEIGLFAV